MKLFGMFLTIIALNLLVSGCGQPKADLVPVTGTVKIDGEPTEGIMVLLLPDTQDESANAPSSQGISDENGNFELFTTKNEPGAVVGKHKVTLVDTHEERGGEDYEGPGPQRLDPKYSMVGQISVEIAAGKKLEIEASSPE